MWRRGGAVHGTASPKRTYAHVEQSQWAWVHRLCVRGVLVIQQLQNTELCRASVDLRPPRHTGRHTARSVLANSGTCVRCAVPRRANGRFTAPKADRTSRRAGTRTELLTRSLERRDFVHFTVSLQARHAWSARARRARRVDFTGMWHHLRPAECTRRARSRFSCSLPHRPITTSTP